MKEQPRDNKNHETNIKKIQKMLLGAWGMGSGALGFGESWATKLATIENDEVVFQHFSDNKSKTDKKINKKTSN